MGKLQGIHEAVSRQKGVRGNPFETQGVGGKEKSWGKMVKRVYQECMALRRTKDSFTRSEYHGCHEGGKIGHVF